MQLEHEVSFKRVCVCLPVNLQGHDGTPWLVKVWCFLKPETRSGSCTVSHCRQEARRQGDKWSEAEYETRVLSKG